MHIVRPRELVILAEDRKALVKWYIERLGFEVVAHHEKEAYSNLETKSGVQIGIGSLSAMEIEAASPRTNAVIMQIEVEDVPGFFADLKASGDTIVFGPDESKADGYWYGAIADPEGNQIWVVDPNCP